MTDSMKQIIGVVGAIIVLLLVVLVIWFNGNNNVKDVKLEQANQSLAIQTAANDLKLTDQTSFTETAQSILDVNVKALGKADVRANEIRNDYKDSDIANQCMPAATSDRLLKYAYNLRAAAMHPDKPIADGTDANPPAGACITYKSAAVWINYLLSALETANNDKSGIREQERKRVENYKKATASK